ncbi:MAG: hypothetical protein J5970_05300 [Bacilli bacterium]|nr:hypothetical protein [Bacilli bacterium]
MNNTELKEYLEEYNSILKDTKNKKKAIRVASSKTKIKEENSNKLLVYVGTYKVDKYVTKAVELLTYENDPKAKYKRYLDVETGKSINVNMDSVQEFEETHKVIYREVVMENIMLHYQNYQDVRDEFFEDVITEPQDKVVLKLVNSSEK